MVIICFFSKRWIKGYIHNWILILPFVSAANQLLLCLETCDLSQTVTVQSEPLIPTLHLGWSSGNAYTHGCLIPTKVLYISSFSYKLNTLFWLFHSLMRSIFRILKCTVIAKSICSLIPIHSIGRRLHMDLAMTFLFNSILKIEVGVA